MGNKLILIIDDDAELCEEMTVSLRDEGYSVTNTSDSNEGESLIKKHIYDIVILDLKMPGLNGIDLLRKIKNTSQATSVFLITGRPFIEKLLEEEKVAHLVAGYLNKPFNDKVLIEKINSVGVTLSSEDF